MKGLSKKLAEFFRGKRIAILGATGGLGEALARELHAAGVELILIGRNKEKLIALQHKLSAYSDSARSYSPNYTKPIYWTIQEAEEILLAQKIRNYSVHGLICVTGKTIYKQFTLGTWDEYRELLQVNLYSILRLALETLPYFEQNHGFFHVAGSYCSFIPVPYQAVYSASKAALYSFISAASREYKSNGLISISLIGGMATQMYYNSGLKQQFSQVESLFIETPDQVARALLKGIMARKSIITIRQSGWWAYHVLRRIPLSILGYYVEKSYRPQSPPKSID